MAAESVAELIADTVGYVRGFYKGLAKGREQVRAQMLILLLRSDFGEDERIPSIAAGLAGQADERAVLDAIDRAKTLDELVPLAQKSTTT